MPGRHRHTSDKKQVPAYKDQQLEDRPGEQWEDIPGLDGYFLISDHGRIKRAQYETQYRNGAIYVKPEMIIKPRIQRNPNRYKRDFQYFVVSKAVLEGKTYYFSVGRLVYYCFVQKFDLEDLNQVISYKDNDHFNLRYDNLVLATISQRRRNTFEKGRALSPFNNPSETLRKNRRAANIKRMSKQVTQYSLRGKKLRTFSSMAEAQRATGAFASSIAEVVSGKGITAGGFVWRWGNAPSVDMAAYRKIRREKLWEEKGQKVTQFDLAGNIIAHYPSLQHAHLATGISKPAIRLQLKGVYKSTKGFFWKKGYARTALDLSGHLTGNAARARSRQKKVKQYTLKGRCIRTFDSLKEAVAHTGISKTSISHCCRGKKKSCKGYIWKFA